MATTDTQMQESLSALPMPAAFAKSDFDLLAPALTASLNGLGEHANGDPTECAKLHAQYLHTLMLTLMSTTAHIFGVDNATLLVNRALTHLQQGWAANMAQAAAVQVEADAAAANGQMH